MRRTPSGKAELVLIDHGKRNMRGSYSHGRLTDHYCRLVHQHVA